MEAALSPNGVNGLKDNRARMRLLTRLDRAALGNLGDWRSLTDARGIAELRDGYGPGYRVYFSFVGQNAILLLAGSSKRDQRKAIEKAKVYLADYKRRTEP